MDVPRKKPSLAVDAQSKSPYGALMEDIRAMERSKRLNDAAKKVLRGEKNDFS